MQIQKILEELAITNPEVKDWTVDVNPIGRDEIQIVFARLGAKYGMSDPLLFMTVGNDRIEPLLPTIKTMLSLWALCVQDVDSNSLVPTS